MEHTPLSFKQSLQQVLKLSSHWVLDSYQLLSDSEQLILTISHNPKQTFKCPVCEKNNLMIVRKEAVQSRFLNFFHFHTHIHSSRIWCQCPVHGEQRIMNPWETELNKQLNI